MCNVYDTVYTWYLKILSECEIIWKETLPVFISSYIVEFYYIYYVYCQVFYHCYIIITSIHIDIYVYT
jgi:hypothetical protein